MSIYVLMSKSAYSQQIGHNTEPVRRQECERKKENSGCGCLFVALWFIALIAACFVYLVDYPEYFGAVVLCILVVIFVFCLIIHSLSDDGSLKDDITEEQEQPEFESTRPSNKASSKINNRSRHILLSMCPIKSRLLTKKKKWSIDNSRIHTGGKPGHKISGKA